MTCFYRQSISSLYGFADVPDSKPFEDEIILECPSTPVLDVRVQNLEDIASEFFESSLLREDIPEGVEKQYVLCAVQKCTKEDKLLQPHGRDSKTSTACRPIDFRSLISATDKNIWETRRRCEDNFFSDMSILRLPGKSPKNSSLIDGHAGCIAGGSSICMGEVNGSITNQ